MAFELKDIEVDPALKEEGKWLEYGAPQDGLAFLVSYFGQNKYEHKLAKLATEARRKNRNRVLPPEEDARVTREAMVGTILLDWRNLTYKGEPFPFNRANALFLLENYRELREFIQVEATVVENFQKAAEDEDYEDEGDKPQAELKSGPDVVAGERGEAASP